MESWDIVIIGSGPAALRAAVASADAGTTPLVIDSSGIGSASGAAPLSGLAASIDELDSTVHRDDTVTAGGDSTDKGAAARFCGEAVSTLAELERWGLVLRRRDGGLPHTSEAPGHSRPRLTGCGDSTAREVSRLLESAVSGKTVLAYELRSRLDIIHADASQLSQVLLNLVTNAAEAVGDGEGRITVRTGAEQGRAAPRATNRTGDLAPGPHVFFEVEDTGCGIDDATASRIFEPFFTTKFTGRGLGLAAALGIVRGHGGTIEIDSKPGRGSRFRVLLPVEPVPGAQPQADRAAIR